MLPGRLDRSSVKLNAFDHSVLRNIRGALRDSSFLAVAVSGGADSVLLMHMVSRLRPLLALPIYVFHVHHGQSPNKQSALFRNRAQDFVKTQCEKLGFVCLTNKIQKNGGRSEAELRQLRYRYFEKWMRDLAVKHGDSGLLLLAHHRDDLLETRLIRLIRGTGPAGLRSMSLLGGRICRPFLDFDLQALSAVKKRLRLKHVADPSNRKLDPLRNWIRRSWLVQLEKKRPGSVRRLALSLESLVEALPGPFAVDSFLGPGGELDRKRFVALDPAQRKEVMVSFLQHHQIRGYTSRHVDEICKRLGVQQKNFTFTLLKLVWLINAQHIRVQAKE